MTDLKSKVNKRLNLSTQDLVNDHGRGEREREQRPGGRGTDGPPQAGLVSAWNPMNEIAQDENGEVLPVSCEYTSYR